MLLKKILKYIKAMFRSSMYYNEEFGWYSIVNIKFRTDYLIADALIINNDGIWYKVPYIWLMNNSMDENGHLAKANNKWF